MPLALDGIVSGLDTTALISAILTARTVSIDTLKTRLADLEKQRDAVAGVKTRMTTVSTKIGDIATTKGLLAYNATTSSTSFAVTATSEALPGSYSVKVDQLASAQVSDSQGFADKSAHTLAQGTMSVTVGGVTTDITVDGTNDTLAGLAASLSEIDGLSAYVVNTGSAADPYRLVIQSDDTGAANGFTIDTSGLAGGDVPAFTQRTAAQNALVQVSGVAVESASNKLTGVIPGLTFDLSSVNAAAESVTVIRDDAAIRDKFKAFVDAYNEMVSNYQTQTVFNAEKGLRGGLVGESTTRRAIDDLSSIVTRQFAVPGSSVTALSSLGISTDRDGKLSFDEDKFDTALAADPDGVIGFVTSEDGALATLATRIDETYVDSDNGSLVTRGESIGDSIDDMNLQIEKAEERLQIHADILRDKFTAMELVLARLQSTQGFVTNLINSGTKSSSSS